VSLIVKDADEIYARAEAAGAKIVENIETNRTAAAGSRASIPKAISGTSGHTIRGRRSSMSSLVDRLLVKQGFRTMSEAEVRLQDRSSQGRFSFLIRRLLPRATVLTSKRDPAHQWNCKCGYTHSGKEISANCLIRAC
jgi:hypothetical protein